MFVVEGLVSLNTGPFKCGKGADFHVQTNRKGTGKGRRQAVSYKIVAAIHQRCNSLIYQNRVNDRAVSSNANDNICIQASSSPVVTIQNIRDATPVIGNAHRN